MEYYSTINKNESVSFAGKWVKLDIIMKQSSLGSLSYCYDKGGNGDLWSLFIKGTLQHKHSVFQT